MRYSALVLLILTGSLSFAQDEFKGDGNQLIVDCAATIRMIDSNYEHSATMSETAGNYYCLGLVRGVSTTLAATDHVDVLNIPEGQIISVVDKYLRDHPEELSEKDFTLIGDLQFRNPDFMGGVRHTIRQIELESSIQARTGTDEACAKESRACSVNSTE